MDYRYLVVSVGNVVAISRDALEDFGQLEQERIE
jgi:hypothetical protein